MRTEEWKGRRAEFVQELERLRNMLSDHESNTPSTFQNVLQVAIDCEFVNKEIFCKRFGLTHEGLEMWMDRSNQDSYVPTPMYRPKVFEFIYDEMTKPT